METFLTANWQNLIMANYVVPPNILLPYLPKGTQLDFHDGETFVSLVGFLFADTSIFGIPIPFLGTFEEVNLRFYVIRKSGNEWKRGVVFINETVPNKLVALLANYLYKEHYISIPTKHKWTFQAKTKEVSYQWKMNGDWNEISTLTTLESTPMIAGSIEEFILEHYYGYTKIDDTTSEEYNIEHARWKVNKLMNYNIQCDFNVMYGPDFSFLNVAKPHSVMLAEGSPVAVKWKRHRF